MIVTEGKYDEALVYYQEALDASRFILGNTHPHTLACISNMGAVIFSQGELISGNVISLLCMIFFYVNCNIYL